MYGEEIPVYIFNCNPEFPLFYKQNALIEGPQIHCAYTLSAFSGKDTTALREFYFQTDRKSVV